MNGSLEEKRAVLEETHDRTLPAPSEYQWSSLAQQVDFAFSTRELCEFMAQVERLPLMTVNPGLAEPSDWARAAFKGGDEPGVLNGTMWLESRGGQRYCLSATWNEDGPLDKREFWQILADEISTLKNAPPDGVGR